MLKHSSIWVMLKHNNLILRRWHLFSLRALVVLIGITAGFFSIASTVGYVEATIVLLASIVLFIAIRRPKRVHLSTAVILTLVTGILLWANLRPTGWQEEFIADTPTDLDAITQSMFWRGWPLSPCMVSLFHGMKFHSDGVEWVLFFDGILFVMVLIATKAVCERVVRH
jgi:hypothetical protein